MKKLTIFDIAKILQFDEKTTLDLKNQYETADDEGKVEISSIMWDAFFELHKNISNLKYRELMDEVANGKRELTNDLYLQAKKLAMKDLEANYEGKPLEDKQIEDLRNKLKNLTDLKN